MQENINKVIKYLYVFLLIFVLIINKRINAENIYLEKFNPYFSLENPIAFVAPPLPLICIGTDYGISNKNQIGIKAGITSGLLLAFAQPPDHEVGSIINVAPTYQFQLNDLIYLGVAINFRYNLFVNYSGFTYKEPSYDKTYFLNENAMLNTTVFQILNAYYIGFSQINNIHIEAGYNINFYENIETVVHSGVNKKYYPININNILAKEKNYWINVLKYYKIHFSIKYYYRI